MRAMLACMVCLSQMHSQLCQDSLISVLDFFLARRSPGAFHASTTTRPLIDAQGHVLLVGSNGESAFSSSAVDPRITRFDQLADGRFDLQVEGLPFGVFEMWSSTDLEIWELSPGVMIPLDGDGFGSVLLDAAVEGEARHFWRGVYRPF